MNGAINKAALLEWMDENASVFFDYESKKDVFEAIQSGTFDLSPTDVMDADNDSTGNEPYKIISQTINPHNGWRCTWYERVDGSRFSVGIPRSTIVDNGQPAGYMYDEDKEKRTADRTYSMQKLNMDVEDDGRWELADIVTKLSERKTSDVAVKEIEESVESMEWRDTDPLIRKKMTIEVYKVRQLITKIRELESTIGELNEEHNQKHARNERLEKELAVKQPSVMQIYKSLKATRNPHLEAVSRELINGQCYSVSIHILKTIEKITEELAEKEAELKHLKEIALKFNDDQNRRLNIALEALEFYANPAHYNQPKPFYTPFVHADMGVQARQAIQQIKGEQP